VGVLEKRVIPLRQAVTLTPAFFNRDPRKVARELLGKLLVRRSRMGTLAGRIVETEAYLGAGDEAAHSFAGKTPRNSVLFGPPGFVYVYFIYGTYYCLNVSCLPDGVAGGVLFRALEPIMGIDKMAEARGIKVRGTEDRTSRWLRQLTSGPGRLCEAFGITRERDNGKNFTSARSDLQLVSDGFRAQEVVAGPRIGIKKSVEHPYRYIIRGNPFVSGPRLRQDRK
jgi:DNA-3-methyladenine glycosylase